jgi:midasin (ATPase involved in ribosome maturation)
MHVARNEEMTQRCLLVEGFRGFEFNLPWVQVIAYIASQFRKDKIWLRRTRPNKRQYQVVLAIDDSRSMSETGSHPA